MSPEKTLFQVEDEAASRAFCGRCSSPRRRRAEACCTCRRSSGSLSTSTVKNGNLRHFFVYVLSACRVQYSTALHTLSSSADLARDRQTRQIRRFVLSVFIISAWPRQNKEIRLKHVFVTKQESKNSCRTFEKWEAHAKVPSIYSM